METEKGYSWTTIAKWMRMGGSGMRKARVAKRKWIAIPRRSVVVERKALPVVEGELDMNTGGGESKR